jgi:hypothetical protein
MGKEGLFTSLPDNLPKPPEAPQQAPLPAELAGKSPAEIFEILKTEHNRDLEEERQRMKAEAFDNMNRQASPNPPPRESTTPGVPFTPPLPNQQEAEPDFFTDQNGFMDRQFQTRVGPVVQATFASLKEQNKSIFDQRMQNDPIYKKYGGEVQAFVDNLSPNLQITPKAYELAYNMVRSQHFDELAEERAKTAGTDFARDALRKAGLDEEKIDALLSGDSPQSTPTAPQSNSLFQRNLGVPTTPPAQYTEKPSQIAPKNRSAGLSAEQKAMAGVFGMTETEYKEYAKLNTDIFAQLGE